MLRVLTATSTWRGHAYTMICCMALFFLLVTVAEVAGSVHGEGCEDGWQHFRNCCYSFHLGDTNYNSALTACDDLGGQLASVWTEDERVFITDKLWQPKVSANEFAWFGLYGTVDNTWAYPDKSNVTMDKGVLTHSDGRPSNVVSLCGAFMGTGGLAFMACGDLAQGFFCKKALPRVFAKSSLLNHTIPNNAPPPTRGAQLFERVLPPSTLEFPPDHLLAESGAADSETGCAFRCFNVHGCNAFRVNCIVQEKCHFVTCTLLA